VPERGEVVAVIGRVLRDEIGISRAIRPEDDLLTDLQLDSVGILTLVVGLEDHFRVALAEQDAASVRTVDDLATLVAARAEAR
jgi:acyl carrier protein